MLGCLRVASRMPTMLQDAVAFLLLQQACLGMSRRQLDSRGNASRFWGNARYFGAMFSISVKVFDIWYLFD